MAGLETPKPAVASPTVAGPWARRSTMPRRIGWDSALNGSLTTGLTVLAPANAAGRTVPPLGHACSRALSVLRLGQSGRKGLDRYGHADLDPAHPRARHDHEAGRGGSARRAKADRAVDPPRRPARTPACRLDGEAAAPRHRAARLARDLDGGGSRPRLRERDPRGGRARGRERDDGH